MINYIEKGYGLHEYLDPLDLGIAQIDGIWQPTHPNADINAINAAIQAYEQPLPNLNPRQWRALLGLIDVVDKIQPMLAQIKDSNRVQYANLYASIYSSEYYEYQVAIGLFVSVKPVFMAIDDQLDLSEDAIKDAWLIAVQS